MNGTAPQRIRSPGILYLSRPASPTLQCPITHPFGEGKHSRFILSNTLIRIMYQTRLLFVGADGPNRRTVKRMCVSECIVVVVQSVFYLRIG
jgi:hypothetical protein